MKATVIIIMSKNIENGMISKKKCLWQYLMNALCPEEKRGTRHLIFVLLSLATMVASLGVVIYYICGPMEGYLHADYTDTIYWANASYESGKVLDPDFKYAGILPFSANLWFIPYIAIFGVSMTAHKLGMITYLVLQSAAIWFMLRSFKWSISSTSLTISAFLRLLSGSEKLREMMWGHVIYYSLAVLLLCVGLGLISRLSETNLDAIKNGKTGGAVKYALLIALAALLFGGNGTNGFQLIVLVTLPCMVCAVADVFFSRDKKLLDKGNNVPYITVAVIVVSTVIGILLLKYWQGDITVNYTAYYSKINPADKGVDNFMRIPMHWFTLLGCDLKESKAFLEPESIGTLIFAFVGLLLAVLPVVGLANIRKIENKGSRAILWAHLTVSAVVIFGYTCGNLGNVNWRMLPMLATAILASAATLKYFADIAPEKSFAPKRIAVVLAALMALGSAYNFRAMAKMDYDFERDDIYHQLAEELEAMGLEYGYATFWYSQSITLLSDSKVKTRMILADPDDGVTTDYYQNNFNWYEDVEGVEKYFVLLTKAENRTVEKSDKWNDFLATTKHEKDYLFDNYVLYVFEENLDFPDPELFK